MMGDCFVLDEFFIDVGWMRGLKLGFFYVVFGIGVVMVDCRDGDCWIEVGGSVVDVMNK